MLKVFKNHNPYIVILLFLSAIIFKFKYLALESAVAIWEQNGLFAYLGLEYVKLNSFWIKFIVFVNYLGQALFLNHIVLKANLFPFKSYLPAFTFLMVSTLIPEWSVLTPALLNNWLILIALNYLMHFHEEDRKIKRIFNAGLITGVSILIVGSSLSMLLVFLSAIALLSTWNFRETLLLIFGFLSPYYLLAAILFLQDKLDVFPLFLQFELPNSELFYNLNLMANMPAMVFMVILLLMSLFVLNSLSVKMLMQVKNVWFLNLLAVLIFIVAGIFNLSQGFSVWLPALLVLSIIFTNIWYSSAREWILNTVFYLSIIITLLLQWF